MILEETGEVQVYPLSRELYMASMGTTNPTQPWRDSLVPLTINEAPSGISVPRTIADEYKVYEGGFQHSLSSLPDESQPLYFLRYIRVLHRV